MESGLEIWMHAIYMCLSVGVTIWVARTLYKHGAPFLVDAFHGDERLAGAVNHLLIVGFYLINIGWIAQTVRSQVAPETAANVMEIVADKFGVVLLVLGGMHFFNLYVFSRIRRRAQLDRSPPPVRASEHLNYDPVRG